MKFLLFLTILVSTSCVSLSNLNYSIDFSNRTENLEAHKDNFSVSPSFDFGELTVSQNNVFRCSILYNKIPDLDSSFEGNIQIISKSCFQEKCNLVLSLPMIDGELRINCFSNDEHYNLNLYSSLSDDGQYYLSTLSMYSAQFNAGNIDNQELFDNDNVFANDLGPTPDFDDSGRINNWTRDIASGRVYGYLKWTDEQNVVHPLIGAKVKLTFTASWGSVSTYTNSSGYYDLSFNNMWTAWAFECDIHIYPDCDVARVANNGDTVYEKAERLTSFPNGGTKYYSYTFSPSQDGDLGRAMSIFTSLKNYADYAQNLNGGNSITKCTVRYPTTDGAYYQNGSNYICLGNESLRYSNSYPAVFASWDTIGHEYGHHLQKHFFFRNYTGNHVEATTDFYTYVKQKDSSNDPNYVLPTNDYYNAKKQSSGLAWKEAWPTFFSVSAQNYFSNDIKSINTVNDTYYESFNGVLQNLDSMYQTNGETSEEAIMCFLYQLWDSANNGADSLTISDSDLWTILVSTNPEFFCDFVSAVYASGLFMSRSDFGHLLEAFKFSSSNISISAYDLTNYNYKPSFSWTKNGKDITYKTQTYNLSNDLFDLVFYDGDMNYIFEIDGVSNNSYTLQQNEWEDILSAEGSEYYLMIRSFDTFGMETGPYYSHLYNFAKPSGALSTPDLSYFANERYFEQRIVIAPGTKWRMNLNFPYSGYKAIQTFGTKDTKLHLYQADGTTLIKTNDDAGYGYNAFICLNAAANTNYVLDIEFYDSEESGETKISITPFYGFLADGITSCDSYESFVNINTYHNFTWTSYMVGHSSNIITWSPPANGNYTISLESDFDNYLYVIDPTSSSLAIRNVDYNDDSDGTNAALTNDYVTSKNYFVVYSQYNPSNTISGSNTIVTRFAINQFN